MVRRSDEGCSATQKLDFLRSRHYLGQFVGAAFLPRLSRLESRSHTHVEVAKIMIKAQRSGTLLFGLYRKSVNRQMKDAIFFYFVLSIFRVFVIIF